MEEIPKREKTLVVKTMNEWIAEAKLLPDTNLKPRGIYISIWRKNGSPNSLLTEFDMPIEKIINHNKILKDWIGGEIRETYLEFNDTNGNYFKEYIDVSKYQHLLATPF